MVKSNKGLRRWLRRLSRYDCGDLEKPNRTTKDTKDYEEFDGAFETAGGLLSAVKAGLPAVDFEGFETVVFPLKLAGVLLSLRVHHASR